MAADSENHTVRIQTREDASLCVEASCSKSQMVVRWGTRHPKVPDLNAQKGRFVARAACAKR